MKAVLYIILLGLLICASLSKEARRRKKNVIMMIPDGLGPSPTTLARHIKKGPLFLDDYLLGISHTQSADSLVTDSAAAATALATGYKTNNLMVGVDPKGQPLKTVLEAARDAGYKTGIVVTCILPHATPGGFSAHVENREMYEEIAKQQSKQRIDVLFGGGQQYFMNRTDGENLLENMKREGYQVILNVDQLREEKLKTPIIGLFAKHHLKYKLDRDDRKEPSLVEMTKKALELLSDSENGFFLLIEGSRIDHALHINDAASAIGEILEFDEAFKVAVEYAKKNDDTMVISVADHDTAGLSLGSAYQLRPSTLQKVKKSTEAIGNLISNGMNFKHALYFHAGIDDIKEEEIIEYRRSQTPQDKWKTIGKMIAKRTLIEFAHNDHTGVCVNLYGYGGIVEKLRFSKDNTMVPRVINEFLNLGMNLTSTVEYVPIVEKKVDVVSIRHHHHD